MRTARNWLGRIRVALDRPRLWRTTAGLAALMLGGLLVGAAQGSIDVIVHRPTGGSLSARAPWERWCATGRARQDRRRLAYCARVDGLVLTSSHGPAAGETHVAVVSDFHLTIVRLPDRSRTPAFGSRLVAVGPLVRARDGQREVQAFRMLRG